MAATSHPVEVAPGQNPRLSWANLLQRGACSFREALTAFVALSAVGFAVYGAHVVRGGFFLDDWAYASEADGYGRTHGVLGLADRLLNDPHALLSAGGRPLAALFFAATYKIFGSNPTAHLVLAIVFAILMSTTLFVVLRNLGVERIHAGMISVLVLVFPASDSTRFWAAADVGSLAIVFFLGGLLLALAGLRAEGARRILFHVGALLLYLLSLMTYEVAAVGVILAVLVYRLRAPWRASVVRWAADLLVVAGAGLYLRSTTTKGVASFHGQIDRARTVQNQARTLVSQLGIQDGRTLLPVPVAALLIAIASVLAYRRLGGPLRDDLRRWLVTAVAGVLAVGVGYAVFVSATDAFYVPLSLGIGNRTNVAAATGYVLFLYSLALLAGLVVCRSLSFISPRRGTPELAATFAVVVALLLAALWVKEVNHDRQAWDRAYSYEHQTVQALRAGPRPPRGATVYIFGVPGETAPLVSAFIASWDLTGAVRLIWHDPTLHGIPGASVDKTYLANGQNWGILCGRQVQPRGWQWSPKDASAYDRTVFVNVPSKTHVLVRSRGVCRSRVFQYLGYRQS